MLIFAALSSPKASSIRASSKLLMIVFEIGLFNLPFLFQLGNGRFDVVEIRRLGPNLIQLGIQRLDFGLECRDLDLFGSAVKSIKPPLHLAVRCWPKAGLDK